MKVLKRIMLLVAMGSCATMFATVPAQETQQERSKTIAKEVLLNGGKLAGYAAGVVGGAVGALTGFALTRDFIRNYNADAEPLRPFYLKKENLIGTVAFAGTFASIHFAWYCLKNGLSLAGDCAKKIVENQKAKPSKK
jgi:hypothetical protein